MQAGEADHHRDEATKNKALQARQGSPGGNARPLAPAPPEARSDGLLRDAWDSGMPLPGGPDPLMAT